MSIYIISYDLIDQKNYPKISEAIKSYERWCKPLLSVWAIKTNKSAIQIRDHLRLNMDSDDKLLVIKLASPGEGAWYNLPADVSKWLQDEL